MSSQISSLGHSQQNFELAEEHMNMLDPLERRIYEEMTQEKKDEYKEIFAIFDSDGSGSIQHEEIADVMRTLGQNPTDEEVDEMVKKIDVDGNGEVEFEEFLILMI